MKQHTNIIITVLLMGLAGLALAQEEASPLKITANVSHDTIRIGDTVVLQIIVEGDRAYQLLRVEPSPEIGVFEIQKVLPVEDKKLKGKRWQKIYAYVLSTFDVGEFEIPPFTVFYQSPDEKEKSAATQPIKIKVESIVKTAEEKIDVRDIKLPLMVRVTSFWQYIIPVIVALILITAGTVYYLRRRALLRKSMQPEEAVPARLVEEVALEELDKLVASDLLAKNKLKLYYIRLSEIIRTYLGRRHNLPALDMTSFELLNALEPRLVTQLWEKVEKFFEECDLVKFAKHKPPAHRPKEIVEEAREIVRLTTPEPVMATVNPVKMQNEN